MVAEALSNLFVYFNQIPDMEFLQTSYMQRNIFEILLNKLEIRLYLPFPINFGSKRMSVWIQPNRKMVNIM